MNFLQLLYIYGWIGSSLFMGIFAMWLNSLVVNPPISISRSNITVNIPPSSTSPVGTVPDFSMLIVIAIILVLYFVFMLLTRRFFTRGKEGTR